MPHDSDTIEMQEKIYLGGHISNKFQVFQKIARMTPDYAFAYLLIEKFEEWEKTGTDDEQIMKELLELLGEIELVRQCTELTRLSMVVGDPRKRDSFKRGMDELRISQSNPKP